MLRREFLKTSALVSLGTAIQPARIWAAAGNEFVIPIFHTTDLHGHILPGPDYANTPNLGGLARCVTQINKWRAEFPQHLLLDIGDLYQGTAVGWQTGGRVMVDCLNHLNYDAWVIGNHEFDWGADPLRQCVTASRMPVLSANALIGERALNGLGPAKIPGWENLAGALIKDVAGFKIAVIGLTTPGLTYWIPDNLLGDFRATDPVEALRPLIAAVESQGVDAIIIAAHMGLRFPNAPDDFANRVNAICAAFPQVSAFIGAHTHKDFPESKVANVPYTQVNYHGINVGRLDLVFDRDTRKVVNVASQSVPMGPDVELDPGILSLCHKSLQMAEEYLNGIVGVFTKDFAAKTVTPGQPTQLEILYGAAFSAKLAERGAPVDGVFHGMFWNMGNGPLAGEKTIDDIWRLLPFENYLVTAEFTGEQLEAIMRENLAIKDGARSLSAGLLPAPTAGSPQVIRQANGQVIEPRETVKVAMNAYDAQSAGQKLNQLRAILAEPGVKSTTHPVQTREALIDYIKAKGAVDPGALG